MTKADLVALASNAGLPSREGAEKVVDTILDSIVEALQKDDKVEIRGFGSFRTRSRNPRIGRNPKTGAKVDVPAKRVPFFKPSKELRDLVNVSVDGAAETSPAPSADQPVLPIDPHHPPAM